MLLGNTWDAPLQEVFASTAYQQLDTRLQAEHETCCVFPPRAQVFQALRATPYDAVRVVILGQDPYHGAGQAHGFSFSVPQGVKQPPSLRNILIELEQDLGIVSPQSGDLTAWAKQGVLLLNTTLTVRQGQAGSHKHIGWTPVTDAIIASLNAREQPIVFLLWGAPAQQKRVLIQSTHHLVLCAPHPSPLSAYRGFFGCRHFSKTNEFLRAHGQPVIDWAL